MNDRTVRMSCVIAAGVWVLAVVTVLAGTISVAEAHPGVALALYAHAVLFVAAASVATIKVYMERNVRLVLDAMKLTGVGALRQVP